MSEDKRYPTDKKRDLSVDEHVWLSAYLQASRNAYGSSAYASKEADDCLREFKKRFDKPDEK